METSHDQFIATDRAANASQWRQGELVEVEITDLGHAGEGVGRFDGRVVFVPDTVTGDRVLARLVRVKPQYAQGKLHKILEGSSHRRRPSCIVADKCGGCQWQQIDYDYQLVAKRNAVLQDLERIGGFDGAIVAETLSANRLNYRNKATYPLARSNSGQVQAGYYQKNSHHLINLNQCPIQDPRLDPLLAELKADIQARNWSIYSEQQHRGKLRHLALRIGRRTGEMLVTLVSTDANLDGLAEQAQVWMNRYSGLVGVCLNLNGDRTNAIFGSETRCIAGRSYLQEIFADLRFQVLPTTFFQVHTEAAELLLEAIATHLNLQGDEILVDTYCGVGTLTLPLAKRVQQAIGLEVQLEAVTQAQTNAALNGITNTQFLAGTVETLLPQLEVQPTVVLLDPPRKGCDRAVTTALRELAPTRIVYVSCNPSTLARDLKLLCEDGLYQLEQVQPVDFFAQTAHVESVAFLVKRQD
ncbi:23S rRNA (uracil(1939)-C(5))-methyltransferase RlmD [Microcoleus sp. FACHB-1515]|uniref:23S rRNA (uracil(1939)-C(5))-methyltransferase RlmD n=1 Tax=Cyanophyceae TaxID=3028117 RepID=UPI00168275E8|nr:23S rRNA (uracil(1939)-C(5))-methyltransferase RlmD [Microcoleus sp. FACHB-1515]MBD2088876.1 23S rRNA (uracil(1939)-C(5))-methyltransferase RlmD [Microcoleus sp. FACHB-1515]